MAKPSDLKRETSVQPIERETIFTMIEKQKPGFQLALPPELTADRFTRIAITALKQNPKLQACTPQSLLGSLMTAAQLGLEVNTPLHEAVLIPYQISQKNRDGSWSKVMEAQFQPEYRGMLKLVWNSGMIDSLEYDTICTNDVFEYVKGENPVFRHVPAWDKDRGEIKGYYACSKLKGGGFTAVVKSKEEILKHALRYTKSKKDGKLVGVWDENFDAMAIKTCLIELASKKLPKRTTNEAIKLYQAAQSVNEIRKLDLDLIGKEEIRPEDLKSEYLDEDTAEIVDAETGEVTEPEKTVVIPDSKPVVESKTKTSTKVSTKEEKPEKPAKTDIEPVPVNVIRDAYELVGNNRPLIGDKVAGDFYAKLDIAEKMGLPEYLKTVSEIKTFIDKETKSLSDA